MGVTKNIFSHYYKVDYIINTITSILKTWSLVVNIKLSKFPETYFTPSATFNKQKFLSDIRFVVKYNTCKSLYVYKVREYVYVLMKLCIYFLSSYVLCGHI